MGLKSLMWMVTFSSDGAFPCQHDLPKGHYSDHFPAMTSFAAAANDD